MSPHLPSFVHAFAAPAVIALLAFASPLRAAEYDAAFVTATLPTFVEEQTLAHVSITMRNTGTATWAPGDAFLATQLPQDNFYWCIQGNRYGSISGNRAVLAAPVGPGDAVTFDFDVKPQACRFSAPAPLRFRMLSEIHGTFGDLTPDPGTLVSSATRYVSQQVPSIVPAGATIPVSVTFRNLTNFAWTVADGYTLRPVPASLDTWKAGVVPLPADVPVGATATFTFYVTAPALAGNANFQWRMATAAGADFGESSPATAVSVVAAGPPNYTGLWWSDPAGSEPGWGMNVQHEGSRVFVTWFTYDESRQPWWLAMTADAVPGGGFRGTLFETTGPAFSASPFDPRNVRASPRGTGSLVFADTGTGTFSYTVNGVSQSKAITRQAFGRLPVCTYDLGIPATAAYNFTGLWWAAPAGSESGWGLNVSQQGTTIFVTWFTYDTDGSPLWLSATLTPVPADPSSPGQAGDPTLWQGDLYRTTGPPYSRFVFDPGSVTVTQVGSASLTFGDGNSGTFAYRVGTVAQSKSITRQVIVDPGTLCQ